MSYRTLICLDDKAGALQTLVGPGTTSRRDAQPVIGWYHDAGLRNDMGPVGAALRP
jgi:hypothetical protein